MIDLAKKFAVNTQEHADLLSALRWRRDYSYQKYSDKEKAWRDAEKRFKAYVHTSEAERVNKQKAESGTPTFAQITVPYDYATLLAAHTYFTSVFLSRDPVYQVTGRHGEAQQTIQSMEALLDYQLIVGEHLPVLATWLMDTPKYGLGIVTHYWDETVERIATFDRQQVMFNGMPQEGKTKLVRNFQDLVTYSGNRLRNVRPYDWYPDPRVPAVRFQEGEFCGMRSQCSWNTLLKAASGNEKYFNLKEAQGTKWSGDRRQGSEAIDRPYGADDSYPQHNPYRDLGFVELLEMYVELNPTLWGLVDDGSTRPEIWVFTVANNSVVIGAQPLGLFHSKFPFNVMVHEVDRDELCGRGMMEIMQPLCLVMDWLVNSHFFNTRKIMNDQFIVDPSRVVMSDFAGGPGRLIRLKAGAYGSDVRTVLTQLQNADVTRDNLQQMQLIGELIQRVTGVTDNLMGLVNQSGRKTATEVRTSSSFGINRLKTFCESASNVGFGPMLSMLIQNTQQLYDDEKKFRIAGSLLQYNNRYTDLITPESIAGNFTYVPVDGTLPIDRVGQAQLWKEILLGFAKMPALAANFDVAGIFSWMAQLLGLKNVDQFKMQVGSPEQIAQMVQQGNMVPAGEGLGGGLPKAA